MIRASWWLIGLLLAGNNFRRGAHSGGIIRIDSRKVLVHLGESCEQLGLERVGGLDAAAVAELEPELEALVGNVVVERMERVLGDVVRELRDHQDRVLEILGRHLATVERDGVLDAPPVEQ